MKTAGRKYTDVQVETSLQMSIYSYAVEMAGLADGGEVQLRFDVLTKTKEPELVRYPTTRNRAANLRLFRLVNEVIRAMASGGFPDRGVAVPGVSVQTALLGVAVTVDTPESSAKGESRRSSTAAATAPDRNVRIAA